MFMNQEEQLQYRVAQLEEIVKQLQKDIETLKSK